MDSSNKFSSRLNHWEATDKPVREDFNTDNRILTEDAMWTSDYDRNGNVATAGGIEVMIDQKVALTSGFVVYIHEKIGTEHTLTLPGTGGDNIKFIATADFISGDTLKISGTAVQVLDCDGNGAGAAWAAGDIVTMFRHEDTVRVTTPLLNKASCEWFYPVGCYYFSAVDTNPAELFGFGVWQRAAIGRMLVGVDDEDEELAVVGSTGGEKKHTLITSEMPEHRHNLFMGPSASTAPAGYKGAGYASNGNVSSNGSVSSVGSGEPHNNMPPYETAYIWRRVE